MLITELLLIILLTLVVLFIALSIIYNTVKLGISPMPSSSKAHRAMTPLLDKTGSDTIIDLGSGWGNVVVAIAKQYPHRQIVGYELSYLPWLISTLFKKALRLNNLTLYRQDFYQADLSKACVLVCYLFPEAMEKISQRLTEEPLSVNFLISNNFALPSWQPIKKIQINDFYNSPVYLYRISQ